MDYNSVMKLPIDLNPKVQSYQNKAFPLGIINANAEQDLTPWYCGQFINCRFDISKMNKFEIGTREEFYFFNEGILIKQIIRLYKDTYKLLEINYLDMVIEMLKRNFYIQGNYNLKYIPSNAAYGKTDLLHDYLVYGFDDEKKFFYSVGYTANQIYEPFTISYSEYQKSLDNMKENFVEFIFLQYNKESDLGLNLDKICDELSNYLNSCSIIMQRSEKYGISAIIGLKNYYIQCVEENRELDVRFSRALMEHKYYMLLRIKYLYEHKLFSNKRMLPSYEDIYKKTKTIHRLCLKFNITNNLDTFKHVVELFEEIIEFDSINLRNLLNELETNRSKS